MAGLSDFVCDFEALEVGYLVDLAALLDGCADLEAAGAVVVASELVVVVADEEDPLDELEVEVDDRVTGRNVILVYTICNNTSDGWPVYDNSMLVACSGFPHPHCE